jgi:hypothetical protein
MRIITKELALKIARKLGAQIEKTKAAHDIWAIRHNGKLITTFGIRRASSKDTGHDHIPDAIFLRPHGARSLGQCSISREEWIKLMVAAGYID